MVVRIVARSASLERFGVLDRQVAELTHEVGLRKRAESILEGQRTVLEAIGRSLPLEHSLDEIVALVERWTDGVLGSILLLDEERRLRLGSAPGLPHDYNSAIDGIEIGPEVGSCGSAAHLAEPVLVGDIASDPRWRDFADLAAAHGLGACWSWPILAVDGRVLGSVAAYSRLPREPRPEELEMLRVASRLASIAIERERDRRELEARAEDLLKADRRKDEFLAMLGHELRNPLSAVVTSLAILRRAPGSLPDQLPRLERQMAHLSRLVDDLLEVSRVSRGLVRIRRDPVELTQLVREATETARPTAEARGLTLRVTAVRPPIWISGDGDRLLQVFGNLLSNAIRYTPAGGTIEVRTDAESGDARVVVRDDGEGIAPDFLPLIFNAFTQAERELDRRQGGLGIGLTLVRNLVEQHGGSCEAESRGLGFGSSFRVRIPRIEAPTGSEEVRTALERPDRLRVLVVEDNADSAAALGELLGMWGHECRHASDGPSALDTAVEFRPRVVLLDVGLPQMDGYEVARRLRAMPGFGPEHVLLVAITGYGTPRDRARTKENGFDEHLTKPVDLAHLEGLLARVPKDERPTGSDSSPARP